MVVLVDLEWIEGPEKHLTQLSALRTDGSWNTVDSFDAFVNPGKRDLFDMKHMAFGRHNEDLFVNGMTEQACIEKFERWLHADDEIMVWAKSNQKYLAALWRQYGKQFCCDVLTAAQYIRSISDGDCSEMDPYGILLHLGVATPDPAHRASNDAETLRRLLRAYAITEGQLAEMPSSVLTVRLSQKEINRNRVERSGYHYIYLKHSKVFHRLSCPNWLNAADENDICGCIYYETAAKKRMPCGFCKPKPWKTVQSAEQQLKHSKQGAAAADSEKKEEKQSREREPDPSEVISTKLITDLVIDLKRKHIVGWCHNKTHPGAIDKKICIAHDCLGKNCFYFEQNPVSSYIIYLNDKKKNREKVRNEKKQKANAIDNLKAMQEKWQIYLDSVDSDMLIVRIERAAAKEYTVYYVSENHFADGNRFPEFFNMIKKMYPCFRINLRHIRDLDGHFVTKNEYLSRRKK